MKLKYLWILIIIILLSNIILAEQEITSINNKYVYNKAPDSFPLGSKICFSQEDNRICAPLINFN